MVDFNPNIPQGTDNLSTSQGQLLNNNAQLETIFANDHYTWADVTSANRGYHKQVYFPATRAAPTPSGTQSMFYPKTVAGVAEPFFTNSAADNVMWYGGSTSGSIATASGANQSSGSVTFPNGLILKWGYVTSVSDNVAISFPVAFPNACFTVVPTPMRNSTSARTFFVQPGSIGASSFTIRTDSGTIGATYWAVGR